MDYEPITKGVKEYLDPYWDMFECKELDRAPERDGHTPDEAIARIATLGTGTCHDVAGMDDVFECSVCGGRYQAWAIKRWARYCPDCGKKIVAS